MRHWKTKGNTKSHSNAE